VGRGAGPGGPAGSYALRSLPGEDLEFQAQPDCPSPPWSASARRSPPAPLPIRLIPFDLRKATVDRFHELTFGEEFSPFRPLIDGHTFAEDRGDQIVALGATEEWRLRNTRPD
jgi:FtsP/CotA-like multicopper oxidase with cupredoxin domain